MLIAWVTPSAWVLLAGLLATRLVLEVIYRAAFHEQRYEVGCQLIAFIMQVVAWTMFWTAVYARQYAG